MQMKQGLILEVLDKDQRDVGIKHLKHPSGAALGAQQICSVLEHPMGTTGSSWACGRQPSGIARDGFSQPMS